MDSKKSLLEKWLHSIGFAGWLFFTLLLKMSHPTSGLLLLEWLISAVFAIPISITLVYVLSFIGFAARKIDRQPIPSAFKEDRKYASVFVLGYIAFIIVGFFWGFSSSKAFWDGVFGAVFIPPVALGILGFIYLFCSVFWSFILWLLKPMT